jgi:hypothetical protein
MKTLRMIINCGRTVTHGMMKGCVDYGHFTSKTHAKAKQELEAVTHLCEVCDNVSTWLHIKREKGANYQTLEEIEKDLNDALAPFK